MQAQQAPLIFTEAERQSGDRLLKLALETDRVEGYTEPHAVMMARLVEIIGGQMGLHGTDLSALKFAALAHDIGERGMKRNYLLSPNVLTWEERLDLWRHPILGEQAAAEMKLSRQTQLLVRWHHEWWNGQGYPDGLSGKEIPLGARILRAVDSYCALISRRPYRHAIELAEAEQVIADLAGIEFDPQVVKQLLAVVVAERLQREAELAFQRQQAAVWNVPPELERYSENHEEFQPEVLSVVAVNEVVEAQFQVTPETETQPAFDQLAVSGAEETFSPVDDAQPVALTEADEQAVSDEVAPDQAPTSELPAVKSLTNVNPEEDQETNELAEPAVKTETAPNIQN